MVQGTTFVEASLLDQVDDEARETTPTGALLSIGGAHAVAAVVEEFYTRLLADPVTAAYFRGLDLAALKRHQVLLLVKVLGGPDHYAGRDLRSAHAGLGITDEIYQRVCLYLLTVMHDFKVPMGVLVSVTQVLDSVRAEIVSSSSGSGH